jgi:hypothetical protein
VIIAFAAHACSQVPLALKEIGVACAAPPAASNVAPATAERIEWNFDIKHSFKRISWRALVHADSDHGAAVFAARRVPLGLNAGKRMTSMVNVSSLKEILSMIPTRGYNRFWANRSMSAANPGS